MFSYSRGYYVSPPDDQYLKFKNRCSLVGSPWGSQSWVLTIDPVRLADSLHLQYQLDITTVKLT